MGKYWAERKGCNQNMKKIFVLCMALVVFCSAILFLPTAQDRQIYRNTLRLHVLANSDSEEDQALKLRVRDRVLSVLEEQISACRTREQAQEVILENEEWILSQCREVLAENGSSHDVFLRLCKEYYPTRVYDDMALPSGEYLSLQIGIGQAEGQNWWCVLYPPICLGASSSKAELSKAGFGKEQIKLVSEDRSARYAVKFKILETVGKFLAGLF